jgi:hypothetical protein
MTQSSAVVTVTLGLQCFFFSIRNNCTHTLVKVTQVVWRPPDCLQVLNVYVQGPSQLKGLNSDPRKEDDYKYQCLLGSNPLWP